MDLPDRQKKDFQKFISEFYAKNRRTMPWRETRDPYKILVSEIMLQQTQVGRVIPKYELFITEFPNVRSLAQASLGDVIKVWSGLGYNRRAKYLWQSANQIVESYNGKIPSREVDLVSLPGIGVNTARAILTYTHGVHCPFIETNVRTVIIHSFFKDDVNVSDKVIMELLEQVTPQTQTREFFWGIMDLGSHLKQTQNNITRSKHYKKQSTFEGSKRQLRGKVIRLLTKSSQTQVDLVKQIKDVRLQEVLGDLVKEKLIKYEKDEYLLF